MSTVSSSVILPLCVDLDGTLVRTDVTQESILMLLCQKPWMLFFFPLWILKGRAYFKKQLGRLVQLSPSRLPMNYELLSLLEEKKAQGVPLYLVTAADIGVAEAVAQELGLFEGVLASDGQVNLRAEAKGNVLVHRFGERGFIYAGNSRDDLLVWRYAAEAIAVNAPFNVRAILRRMGIPVYFIKEGDFSYGKLWSLLSFPGVLAALAGFVLKGWPLALGVLSAWTFGRLMHGLYVLRQDGSQSLTHLRVNLLLGHIPLTRAWWVLFILISMLVWSMKKIF